MDSMRAAIIVFTPGRVYTAANQTAVPICPCQNDPCGKACNHLTKPHFTESSWRNMNGPVSPGRSMAKAELHSYELQQGEALPGDLIKEVEPLLLDIHSV